MVDIDDANKRKGDQWISLSGREAKAVDIALTHFESNSQSSTPFWRLFSRTTASDELFFPTLLSILGVLETDHIQKRQVTLVDWEGYTKNPRLWRPEETGDVLKKAKEGGELISRKFDSSRGFEGVDLRKWKELVLGENNKKVEE